MALGDYNIGSSGAGVSDLQRYLNDVGLSIAIDGAYGPETAAAVRAFQEARGIRVDGIAGPETLVELAAARAEGWTVGYAQPPSDAAVPGVVPSHTPGAVVYTPGVQPAAAGAKPAGKLPPIVIIGGVLLLLYLMNRSGGKKSSAPGFSLHQDDFEQDDEPEDEPEEQDDQDDDDGEEG